MFDFTRTVALIRGAIFEPEPTWANYLPEAGNWQKTAALLTGPLVIGSMLLSYILSLILPSALPFSTTPSFFGFLVGIVWALLGAGVTAFIFSFVAGLFKGEQSFAKGLAATSLAAAPAYAGQVLGQLPWVGWLIALGLFIYTLVLLWRIIPSYLGVPDSSRVGHYILSLIGSFVAMLVLGFIFGVGAIGGGTATGLSGTGGNGDAPTGMFGGMERSGKIMDSAAADQYEPPGDGKLKDAQVRRYIEVMTKTKELRASQAETLQKMAEQAEGQEMENIGEMFSGVSRMMEMQTAEMEVVKTGGGNWAEHQWVKEQLRIARIQKDINPSVAHNYKLYQSYEQQLEAIE